MGTLRAAGRPLCLLLALAPVGCTAAGGMPSYSTWYPPGPIQRGVNTVVAAEAQRVNAFDEFPGVGDKHVPELETALRVGVAAHWELSLKMHWLIGPTIPELGLRYQLPAGDWHFNLAASLSAHVIDQLDEVEDADHQWYHPIWPDMDARAWATHLALSMSRWLGPRWGVSFGPKLVYQMEKVESAYSTLWGSGWRPAPTWRCSPG
jgi:hypothetical protein